MKDDGEFKYSYPRAFRHRSPRGSVIGDEKRQIGRAKEKERRRPGAGVAKHMAEIPSQVHILCEIVLAAGRLMCAARVLPSL